MKQVAAEVKDVSEEEIPGTGLVPCGAPLETEHSIMLTIIPMHLPVF